MDSTPDYSLLLKRGQITTFVTMYIGYAFFCCIRKTVTFAMPSLSKEEGLTNDILGMIVSIQNVGYAISKFISGIISDNISPRKFFSLSLTLSGLVNILFSYSSSPFLFILLWFLSGLFQGGSWPSCSKLLQKWYEPSHFGTYWSLLSTSSNLALVISPMLATAFIVNFGWRTSLYVPGIVAMFTGIIFYFVIKDSPSEVGLPEVNIVSSKPKRKVNWQDLLKNPFMHLISVSYLIASLTKTSCVDWIQMYLLYECNRSEITVSAFISAIEVGGIIGSIAAGYMTDWLADEKYWGFQKSNPRTPAVIVYTLGIIGSLHLLIVCVSENSTMPFILCIGFFLGIGIYGPITIIGVVATESFPEHLSGTAHAFAALAGNVGAVLAGLPLTYLAEMYSWKAIFILLEVVNFASIMFMLLLHDVDRRLFLEDEEKIKTN